MLKRIYVVLLFMIFLIINVNLDKGINDAPLFLVREKYNKVKQNFKMIDISGVVNKGYKDDVEDDGKGGWIDAGNNDFRTFNLKGVHKFLNIPFLLIDGNKNNGKTVLILRGDDNKSYPVSAEIKIDSRCAGIYFLHSASWGKGIAGKYIFVYEDGKKIVKKLEYKKHIFNWWGKFESDYARPVWTGKNAVTDEVSVYLYAWKNPRPDKKIKKIIVKTEGIKNYLMLFALTLTDKGPYLPAIVEELVKLDTSDWFPYVEFSPEDAENSVIDMSYLLDPPAGKYGFIKIKKDKFYFSNGKEIRFWGFNMVASGNFLTKSKAEKIAARIAQMGANIVRLHHLDAEWANPNIFGNDPNSTRKLSEASLDKLDYLWYQLKKRGIYIYLDLLVHRTALKNDGIKARSDIVKGYKIEGEFDRHLINLQKEYIKQLLLHKNKYTGKRLIDDPAMVMMEIINEDSLFFIKKTSRFSIRSKYYRKIWKKLFNKWLIKKYKNRANLLAAWREAGRVGLEDFEAPENETVEIPADYRKIKVHNYSKKRIKDIYRFIYDTQWKYYKEMYSFLRKLGVKCAITGSNHWVKDIADVHLNAKLDFVDRHNYWKKSGGNKFAKGAWSNPDPMVKSDIGGIIGEMSTKAVYGKPFVISEWNCYAPNEFRAEGVPILALYSSLHNWNAIQFAYTHSREFKYSLTHVLDVYNKPAITALWPVCSLIFHRRDLKEADTGYFSKITPEEAVNPFSKLKVFPRMGLVAKAGLMFTDIAVSSKFNNKELLKYNDKNNYIFPSSTGELLWNTKKGLISFENKKSLGIIGFTKGDKVKFNTAEINLKTDFAIVILTSLDNKPIKKSKHLLLTAVSRTRQKGMKITKNGRLVDTGTPPLLIQPVKGTVFINAKSPESIYALSLYGKRMKKVDFSKHKKGFNFEMKADYKTVYYEIKF